MTLQPSRRLDIEGAYNVRDLGGYETADGRMTQWQQFLRADNVGNLPRASQNALADYGVRTVIDLRRKIEIEGEPDNVLERFPRVRYHNVDIAGDTVPDTNESSEPFHRITTLYRNLLEWQGKKFGETLTTLAAPGALPAMYHCMGGQDRTGLISAFLLSLAGVPNDTIAEDYTLTAEYRAHASLEPGADPVENTIQKYRERNCPPEVMLDTMQYLDDHHGGVEPYVKSVGVSDAQIAVLREALLG